MIVYITEPQDKNSEQQDKKMSNHDEQDNVPAIDPKQVLQEYASQAPSAAESKKAVRAAKAEASQEIKDQKAILKNVHEQVGAAINAAQEGKKKKLLAAKFARDVGKLSAEALYQTADAEDITPEMKKEHRSYLATKWLKVAKPTFIGAALGATLTFGALKGPELIENLIGDLSNDNASTAQPLSERSAAFKSDGKYYIQIAEASNADVNQLAEGHKPCENLNGTVSMVFKGKSYPSLDAAAQDISTVQTKFPDAWINNELNCSR